MVQRSAALLLLVAVGLGLAHGSLMAIDLGSEYLKVCLIKPGRTPIAIVVNEMSRRKSPALVGLANGDRLLGEEAFSFAIRFPTTVFSRARDLLGRSAADPFVQNMLSANLLPYELVDHAERKTAMAKVNATTAYLAEELVVSACTPLAHAAAVHRDRVFVCRPLSNTSAAIVFAVHTYTLLFSPTVCW